MPVIEINDLVIDFETDQGVVEAPDRQQREIQGIPGVVPNLIDPPQGCRFHTRCTAAMAVCRQTRPPAVELFPDHVVRCHLFPPEQGIDHA